MRLPVILFLLLFCNQLFSSDREIELDYFDRIKERLEIGEIVQLNKDSVPFIAIYSQTASPANKGTVIILHPVGSHPNHMHVIRPLRVFISDHSLATLSLQMPVLKNSAFETDYYDLFDQSNRRIQSAVDYLLSAGVKNIALVGYGMGGMMALHYINQQQPRGIKALVTVSLAVPESDLPQVQVLDFIEILNIPYFDVYAEYDLPLVLASARKRKMAGQKTPSYRQVMFEGEGHLFEHDEGLLVKRIYSWIMKEFGRM